MGYNSSIATNKWWDPHTKKLKNITYVKFDEHNNEFGNLWSPGSSLMNVTNISALQALKIYLSDYTFIKDDIFEATVLFTPRDTPIGIFPGYQVPDFAGNMSAQKLNKTQTKRSNITGIYHFHGIWS